MMFDGYYDGNFKASHSSTMFQIYKLSDTLQFYYGKASAGSTVTRSTAMSINSSGNVLFHGNDLLNRKIVLYDGGNNTNQYHGFGVNAGVLRYQVSDASNYHKFYAANSATSSTELFSIGGNGTVSGGSFYTKEIYKKGYSVLTTDDLDYQTIGINSAGNLYGGYYGGEKIVVNGAEISFSDDFGDLMDLVNSAKDVIETIKDMSDIMEELETAWDAVHDLSEIAENLGDLSDITDTLQDLTNMADTLQDLTNMADTLSDLVDGKKLSLALALAAAFFGALFGGLFGAFFGGGGGGTTRIDVENNDYDSFGSFVIRVGNSQGAIDVLYGKPEYLITGGNEIITTDYIRYLPHFDIVGREGVAIEGVVEEEYPRVSMTPRSETYHNFDLTGSSMGNISMLFDGYHSIVNNNDTVQNYHCSSTFPSYQILKTNDNFQINYANGSAGSEITFNNSINLDNSGKVSIGNLISTNILSSNIYSTNIHNTNNTLTNIISTNISTGNIKIKGIDSNAVNGPNITIFTTDAYPVKQDLNFAHNNISINFDGYFDNAWKISHTSAYQIYKQDDLLKFNYAIGTPGSEANYYTAFSINNSGITSIGNIQNTNITTTNLISLNSLSTNNTLTNIISTNIQNTNLSTSNLIAPNFTLNNLLTTSSTSGLLVENSDTIISTQKAIKEYIDRAVPVENAINGVVHRTASTLSITNPTAGSIISIAPYTSGSSFDVIAGFNRYTFTTDQTIASSLENGLHYTYFNSSGTLQETTTFTDDLIFNEALVSISYYNETVGSSVFFSEERHGINMSPSTHLYLHKTLGCMYIEGMLLGDFVIGNGSDNEDAEFSITGGIIGDEDIELTIDAKTSTGALFGTFYLVGGHWQVSSDTIIPAVKGTTYLQYNLNTEGVWSVEEATNNDYVLGHIFASNNAEPSVRFIGIMGQNIYGSAKLAKVGATQEMTNLYTVGFPTEEWVAIASVIYKTGSSNDYSAQIVEYESGEYYINWINVIVGKGSSAVSNIVNLDINTLITTSATIPSLYTTSITSNNIINTSVISSGSIGTPGATIGNIYNTKINSIDIITTNISTSSIIIDGQDFSTHTHSNFTSTDNLSITLATIPNLLSTNISTSSLIIDSIDFSTHTHSNFTSTGNMSITLATIPNLLSTNISTSSLIIDSIDFSTHTHSNFTSTENLSITLATIPNLLSTNISTSSLIIDSVDFSTHTHANFVSTGSTSILLATIPNLLSTNISSSKLILSSEIDRKKLILFNGPGTDQFYGMGVLGGIMLYQIDSTIHHHKWYAATSTTSSNEIMSLSGTSLLSCENINIIGMTTGTINLTDLISTNITTSSLIIDGQDFSTHTHANFVSTGSTSILLATIPNLLSTNISTSSLIIDSIDFSTHTHSNFISTENLSITLATIPNLLSTNISTSSLIIDSIDFSTHTHSNFTSTENLSITLATISNLLSTNISSSTLRLTSVINKKKLVLYDGSGTDNFYGMGVIAGTMTYQVDALSAYHKWYAATSATSSNEIMSLSGNSVLSCGNINTINATIGTINLTDIITTNITSENIINTNLISDTATISNLLTTNLIGTASTINSINLTNNLNLKKIIIYDGTGNDHQYHGFGVGAGYNRYQVADPTHFHKFYAATSATSSNEIMSISGVGMVSCSNINTIGISTGTLNMLGNISLNDNEIRVRGGDDGNHYIKYTSTYDGIEIRGHGGGLMKSSTTDALSWNSGGEITIPVLVSASNAIITNLSVGNIDTTGYFEMYKTNVSLQILNYDHDNISINFDRHYDGGAWRNQVDGSSYGIYKFGNRLLMNYSTGTEGSEIAIPNAIEINSSGNVLINNEMSSGSIKTIDAVFTNITSSNMNITDVIITNITSPSIVSTDISSGCYSSVTWNGAIDYGTYNYSISGMRGTYGKLGVHIGQVTDGIWCATGDIISPINNNIRTRLANIIEYQYNGDKISAQLTDYDMNYGVVSTTGNYDFSINVLDLKNSAGAQTVGTVYITYTVMGRWN